MFWNTDRIFFRFISITIWDLKWVFKHDHNLVVKFNNVKSCVMFDCKSGRQNLINDNFSQINGLCVSEMYVVWWKRQAGRDSCISQLYEYNVYQAPNTRQTDWNHISLFMRISCKILQRKRARIRQHKKLWRKHIRWSSRIHISKYAPINKIT